MCNVIWCDQFGSLSVKTLVVLEHHLGERPNIQQYLGAGSSPGVGVFYIFLFMRDGEMINPCTAFPERRSASVEVSERA